MSEKLTEEKIDEMIQELLQEKYTYKVDKDSMKKIKPKNAGTKPSTKNIEKLAGIEPKTDELDDKDIKSALLSGDKDLEDIVRFLKKNSQSDDLKADIEDTILDLGGELETSMISTIGQIKDKPEQIAGDISIGGRVAPTGVDAVTGRTPSGKVPTIASYRSTIEQMSVFDQFTGPAKFLELKRIAEAIQNKIFPTDNREMFEFITKANVLNFFGNLAKRFSGLEAGLEFEKFCAVFMNGFQVGGSGGAADVFLRLRDNTVVPTSQKLYANIKGVKQSNSAKEKGLYYLLQKHDVVYYYVGIKESESKAAAYTNLRIYVIKVSQSQDGNNFLGQSLDHNGDYSQPQILGPYINCLLYTSDAADEV